MCVCSTVRGPAVSVARLRRVPRPRASSRRPVTHAHAHPPTSQGTCAGLSVPMGHRVFLRIR
eukprot:3312524-Prymnesium_polylepis.1